MTCSLCRESQADGFRDIVCQGIQCVEECPTGEVPRLHPGNRRFWTLFMDKIWPGLHTGFGGFDFSMFEFVFNLYPIPKGQRPVIYDKSLVVLSAWNEVKQFEKEMGNG